MTQDLQTKIENIINRYRQADDREIVFQLKQMLYETETLNDTGRDAKRIADLVAENMGLLNNESPHADVIKSGFEDFDKEFGGFQLGEFVVVGGRPAMGKTQFLVNLSMNLSKTVPTLYVTLGESEFHLTNRFIAAATGIPVHNFLHQSLTDEQRSGLNTTDDAFAKRRLFIHDSCKADITPLLMFYQKQIQEKGIQVIIIDYLQLLSSYHHRKYREIEVSFICRELKRLAKERHVCVIASSQLSRAVENRYGPEGKRPILSDLRESGSIEQDADKVIFIHRPEYYSYLEDDKGNDLKNVVEIIVAKNRNGCLGSIVLMKDNDFTTLRREKKEFVFSLSRLMELEGLDDSPF